MMGILQATEWLAGKFYEQYCAYLIHLTSHAAPLVTPCTCQASHLYQARNCTGQAPHPQGDIGCIIDSVDDMHSESWHDTVFPFAYNFGRIYRESVIVQLRNLIIWALDSMFIQDALSWTLSPITTMND